MGNTGITKHNVVAFAKKGTTPQRRIPLNLNKPRHQNPSAKPAGKYTKQKIVGTEPMRQMIPAKRNVNSPSQPTKLTNNPYPPGPLNQKTEIAAPTIWGKSRREGVHNRGPPKQVRRRFFNLNRMQRRTNSRLATSLERRHDT